MVLTNENIAIQDSEQAAWLLSEKLMVYKNSNAVVGAIPCGGVPIGYHLATILQLPFEIIPCKKIRHPGLHNESIGSVSMDDAVIHEGQNRIPQDYIYHQIILLQRSLQSKYKFYKGNKKSVNLKNKDVILVDDLLQTSDSMLAGLKSIKNQEPSKIIVAVSLATQNALLQIEGQADETVILQTVGDQQTAYTLHTKFPLVKDEEVRDYINHFEALTSKRI